MIDKNRIQLLKTSLEQKILVLDGATGTALQNLNLVAKDFGGEELEGCNENLILSAPQKITSIHEKYLESGADIIETNTFGATPIVLDEYKIGHLTSEINKKAAQIARAAADKFTSLTPDKPRFVAGSIGPTTKSLSITGGITFFELIDNFQVQIEALITGGVDYLLIETCNDTLNIKAALRAAHQAMNKLNAVIPIAVSVTIEANGTMLAGQTAESLITSLEHEDLLYVGLNCATGPEFMTDHLRTMSEMAQTNISCVPNAGLPDENGNYLETPEMIAKVLENFIEEGWINIIGGCCGTTYDHIKKMSELARAKTPRSIPSNTLSTLSGIDYLEINEEKRPVLIGEKTNVIGSKKFKRLITENKLDEACEIAIKQVKGGADIVDVCMANPDSDELEDMKNFLAVLTKRIKAPLMIDSTNKEVISAALTYTQGKSIINSINLEDGEKRFDEIVPLAKEYGSALVIGCIDEDLENGMAVTRDRKLEITTRSRDLLSTKYNISENDMYFDPLVFPCATGDQKYIGSAIETIEGIRLIKKSFPKCKTVVGLSNVSFGLPPGGREVLNSVFLYHCVKAGLDLAIVNTQRLRRFTQLKDIEIELAQDLIWNKGDDPISKFVEHFRDYKKEPTKLDNNIPIEQRLASYVIEGIKENLQKDLEEMKKTMDPMKIINGPLMNGMKEVGKLFNDNKLIVAEVLQSAEVMKFAVNYLESFMDKSTSTAKKKFLLATVKGDVHDIGKNLVDIVLSNNGYEIINLGIKISSDQLLQAIKKHNPDIIGLSGLLVKSAQEMVNTLKQFSQFNIEIPVLLGGAALSKKFVDTKAATVYNSGDVYYAKDAMDGLRLTNIISDPKQFKTFISDEKTRRHLIKEDSTKKTPEKIYSNNRSSKISISSEIPEPADFKRHILKNSSIDSIWKFINPKMLFTRHLGIKGKIAEHLMSEDFAKLTSFPEGEKAIEIYNEVKQVKEKYMDDLLTTGAVYQFFKAKSDKNSIKIFDETEKTQLTEIILPRQLKENGLCISDYLTPLDEKKMDNMAIFFVTVGSGITKEVERLKNSDQFLRSHILSAMALELAEAYAEYLHGKIRSSWGFPDPVSMTMLDRFQGKYRGNRYSFGYPACPDLKDQKIIFDLLKPKNDIKLNLTEGFMMEPEASVSALVFHHPQTSYFSVGN